MGEPNDILSLLTGLSSQYKSQENVLRQSLLTLGERLAAICKECRTHYSGEIFGIAACGPDMQVYGHLYCGEDGIGIAHRSTEDDICMDEPGVFRCMSIGDCPADWLRRIASKENVVKFVHGFRKHLDSLTAQTQINAQAIVALANSPSISVSDDFDKIAKAVRYDRAVEDWKEAQASVEIKPERAITLACTLLETVCKHVLTDLEHELPRDQSVTPLFRATMRALSLDPTEQAVQELRGFCGGLVSMTQNLGMLRTRFGDAHGRDASHIPLSSRHARLAVNAAGSAATFIMEQCLAMKRGQK